MFRQQGLSATQSSTNSLSNLSNPNAVATGGITKSSNVLSNTSTGIGGQGGTGGTTRAQSGSTSGGNVVSSNYQQTKQSPMAWSPNRAMSNSQENCNNSATFGASAGFGAVSGGVPINDDDCTRRRDAIMWANLGQMRIACERMKQDENNADAMQAAGATCASLTTTLATAPVFTTVKPVVVKPTTFNKGQW